MVTAFILDSLLIRPTIPSSLESYVTETLHTVVEEFKGSGWARTGRTLVSWFPGSALVCPLSRPYEIIKEGCHPGN